MPLYEVTQDAIRVVPTTTFAAESVRERQDIQRLLRSQIDVVSPDTLIVSEEFGDFDDSRRRVDLLGIDRDANLIVIELKRTVDGGHMELQAIRYAAMLSTMTFEQLVRAYTRHLRSMGDDETDAENRLLTFLNWDEPDEEAFAQDVRIVLVSAEFSKELMTSVMWLNERRMDIRCVRLRPHRYDNRVLLDVQQVVPLPEAADYIIRVAEKQQVARESKRTRTLAGDNIMDPLERAVNDVFSPGFIQRRGARVFFLPRDWEDLVPEIGNSWPRLSRACPIVWWLKYGARRGRLALVIELGRFPNPEARMALVQELVDAGFGLTKLAFRDDARYSRIVSIHHELDPDLPSAKDPSGAIYGAVSALAQEIQTDVKRLTEIVSKYNWDLAGTK